MRTKARSILTEFPMRYCFTLYFELKVFRPRGKAFAFILSTGHQFYLYVSIRHRVDKCTLSGRQTT